MAWFSQGDIMAVNIAIVVGRNLKQRRGVKR